MAFFVMHKPTALDQQVRFWWLDYLYLVHLKSELSFLWRFAPNQFSSGLDAQGLNLFHNLNPADTFVSLSQMICEIFCSFKSDMAAVLSKKPDTSLDVDLHLPKFFWFHFRPKQRKEVIDEKSLFFNLSLDFGFPSWSRSNYSPPPALIAVSSYISWP